MPFMYDTKLICDKCGSTMILSSYFPTGIKYLIKRTRENGWSVTKKKGSPYMLHCTNCRRGNKHTGN